MMVEERSAIRRVVVQHLRSTYGIKTKIWNKNKALSCKSTATNSTKVFGVPLASLPYYDMACGCVPSFLVDACMKLQAHVDTEGLFRISGSLVRLKALRAKVDSGEECLSTAFPCDVAGLVKQFFRELPEPVLPTELQEPLLKAQQLRTEEGRNSATMLLSSLLPDRNRSVLRHFFDFLQNVSKRSAENKMDNYNLSVILAPNLLHFGDGTEKMKSNTEKRLKLQTAAVCCFIDYAHDFGDLPQFIEEKVSAMIACESGVLSPVYNELQELDQNSGMSRRHRRSFGVFSFATPVTPTSKRRLPLDSGHSIGFSNKKRRSVMKNLGKDLLPNSLFSGAATPGSAHSASGVLDSSQSTLPSASQPRRQASTSVRSKTRRHSSRPAVNRVESGRASCFSPKVSNKAAPQKSLLLRFSLGKSHKDSGSESTGWRLATQESNTSFCFTKETVFSPSARPTKVDSKIGSKFTSKSEDNLLTPKGDTGVCCTSWSVEGPAGAQLFSIGSFTDTPMSVRLKSNCGLNPAIVSSRPLTSSSLPRKLCCASSANSLEGESSVLEALSRNGAAPVKLETILPESAAELSAPPQESDQSSDSVLLPLPNTPTAVTAPHQQLNLTFDIATSSPLHIDSVILESVGSCSPAVSDAQGFFCAAVSLGSSVMTGSDDSAEQIHCSRLIEALDIQSPAHFRLGDSPGLQSTPLADEQCADDMCTTVSAGHHQDLCFAKAGAESPHNLSHHKSRVADHIQHFNTLPLRSPKGTRVQQMNPPLTFKRTPVRQAVHRINSLLGANRRPTRDLKVTTSQGMKAESHESSLSPHPQPLPPKEKIPLVVNGTRPLKKPPPVPPKRRSSWAVKAKAFALGDVTNKVPPKTKVNSSISDPGVQKMVLQQRAEKDVQHYRGSPRNPLNQPRLLSATKPVML
ncbi:rho GTPase-activating protein 11A-like isoform X1 [Entelurus aequoreus]|uniref:rho GTPase-activating protein 11A-like isoform X1 n=1 Tax=Entelurus aequoreus TaxID=161455 RepID=UPI002B1DC918|nr:rho GTPase-activating protein 11A-like isoform X1 [Entelurus aequoreus]